MWRAGSSGSRRARHGRRRSRRCKPSRAEGIAPAFVRIRRPATTKS
jgi:hypothetical protein